MARQTRVFHRHREADPPGSSLSPPRPVRTGRIDQPPTRVPGAEVHSCRNSPSPLPSLSSRISVPCCSAHRLNADRRGNVLISYDSGGGKRRRRTTPLRAAHYDFSTNLTSFQPVPRTAKRPRSRSWRCKAGHQRCAGAIFGARP